MNLYELVGTLITIIVFRIRMRNVDSSVTNSFMLLGGTAYLLLAGGMPCYQWNIYIDGLCIQSKKPK